MMMLTFDGFEPDIEATENEQLYLWAGERDSENVVSNSRPARFRADFYVSAV